MSFWEIYFIIAIVVACYQAWTTTQEYYQWKITNPAHPVTVQFSNILCQGLIWPATLLSNFIVWQYSDKMKAAIEDYNRKHGQ